MKFWILNPPKACSYAERVPGTARYESIKCTRFPNHQRAGRRIGDLSVYLPLDFEYSILWTWQHDCLITEEAVASLKESGITGISTIPVDAKFKQSLLTPPDLREVRVTGWGGMASPKSGISLVEECDYCGLRLYSRPTSPRDILDVMQWDGSDFFFVWPLPKYVLVSDRARMAMEKHKVDGILLQPVDSLQVNVNSISPGRLSDYLPAEKYRSFRK